MKKIKIIDSYSCFHFHEMFNASFLVKIAYSGEVDQIEYYADHSSWENIKQILLANHLDEILAKTSFHPLKVFPKSWDSISILIRNIISSIYNIKYLFLLKSDETIIYTINNPLSLFFINFISKNKSSSVKIICHGEIELLIRDYPKYKPSFWYKYSFKFFFKKIDISTSLSFIILGQNIKNKLLSMYPNCRSENFEVIDHPYLFSKQNNLKINHLIEKSLRLKIGIIGAVSENKGFGDLLLLVGMFDKLVLEKELKISIIGPHALNVQEYPSLNIVSKQGAALDTMEYGKYVEELDYILFFYKYPSYTLTASGAIFDAIKYKKFIIALKNDYFEYLFSLTGPFGYLVNSVNEMKEVIDDINKFGEKNRATFMNNLEKAHLIFDSRYSSKF